MTHRERLEAKLAKRQEWAEGRAAKSDAAWAAGSKMAEAIPLGQPILVGHHSEKRDRAYRGRIASKFDQGLEHSKMAAHHAQAASGIAAALDSSIFSDDTDADEALTARIAEREAERDKMKLVNKLYRAGDAEGLKAIGLDYEALKSRIERLHKWDQRPYPSYKLTNLGASIRRDKERLKLVAARQARSAAADAAPNGVVIEGTDYVRVTFAEKPAREVLNALKAAGFHWGQGSWHGYRAKLPEGVA